MTTRVVYLHGFASSPQSNKAQFFKRKIEAHSAAIEIPRLDGGDFEHLTITGQLRVVEETVANQPAVLFGSSLGGYLAALFASRHPALVQKLVLLAPGFEFPSRFRLRYTPSELAGWKKRGAAPVFHYGYGKETMLGYGLFEDALRYPDFPEFAQPALIFHGTRDDVVPAAASQTFAASHPNATLHLFDSGHELTDVLEPMWELARPFLGFDILGS